MRVYLDVYCSCEYHDDMWTGNWTDDDVWHLDHSHFDVKVESDVNPGLFSASIRLDCFVKCNSCGNNWKYWIKYGSFSYAENSDDRNYSCCGHNLKLVFDKASF